MERSAAAEKKHLKIFWSIGDPSGDRLAALVLKALRLKKRRTVCYGFGGSLSAAAGLQVLEDLPARAVTGFTEVVRHLPYFWRLVRRAQKEWKKNPPDAVVLVDAPGFHLPLAKRAAALGLPVVYLVAPQVWAWQASRLKTLRKTVKKLLVIFPFEEEYFRKHGLPARYVGYLPAAALSQRKIPRAKIYSLFSIPFAAVPLVAVLAGSRRSEVERHWPVVREAARKMRVFYPKAGFVVVRPPQVPLEAFRGVRADDPFTFVEGPAYEVRAACDLAWVKSGTATVETALLATPHLLFYRVSPLSAFLAKRFLKLPAVGMVNLLLGKNLVPELLQEKANPQAIVEKTLDLLEKAELRERQKEGFRILKKRLLKASGGPSLAAQEIIDAAQAYAGS